MEFDLFISHASEDKADVARPLAAHLQKLGLRVWFDELELTLGDSLRRKIDHGLSRSRYGLVILSPAFFLKEWPNREIDGLVAREDGREKVVLPIWHNVSAADIMKYSPILAGKVAVSTSHGLAHVADRVFEAVRRPSTEDENFQQTLRERQAEITRRQQKQKTLRQIEAEILVRLRKQMLISRSPRELRQVKYELEAYLAKYPHIPEAKMLLDEILAAATAPRELAAPHSRKPSLIRWLLLLGALSLLGWGLIYVLLRFLGVL